MKIFKLCVYIFFSLYLLIGMSSYTKAYQIEPIFPENQVRSDVIYYDLRVYPGQEQTVYLSAKNPSSRSLTLHLDAVTAFTNQYGTVDYMKDPSHLLHAQIPFIFSDIVSIPNEVYLQPNEQRNIPIDIKVPNISFEGIILGAIEVLADDMIEQQVSEGMVLQNQLRYLILMKLSETDTVPSSSLYVSDFYYDERDSELHIKLNNPDGRYIFDLSYYIKVIDQENNLVFDKYFKYLEMAPYSYFDYQVKLPKLDPGEYKIIVDINDEDNWNQIIQDKFVISEQVSSDTEKINYRIFYIKIIILIFIILLIGVIIYKKNIFKHNE